MRTVAHRLADRILGVFGYGLLRVIDDAGAQQIAQLNLNVGGPAAEVIDGMPRLGEYGFFSCPPDGAEAVALFLGGRRTGGVIIATGFREQRPKNLKPGEAMLKNVLGGQFILAAEDGKLHSQAPDWIHAGDQHVSGSLSAAHVLPADGWSGAFATGDARTVTVSHGVITNVG